jgi:hypothetical protein
MVLVIKTDSRIGEKKNDFFLKTIVIFSDWKKIKVLASEMDLADCKFIRQVVIEE